MYRTLRYLVATTVLMVAGCSESQLTPDSATAPTLVPSRPAGPSSLISPPLACPSVGESQTTVDTLLPQLFGPGGGRRGKAQGYSNNIEQQRRQGNTQLEETYVDSLVNFTLQTYYSGHLIGGQSTATQDRVLSFFYALYCASGISPIPDLSGIFGATNTVLIRNETPTTVVSDPLDEAAVKIDQGDVPSTVDGNPFFGTFISVYKTTTPLPTSLDWYGGDGYKAGAYEFVSNPAVTFDDPVLTGVCIEYDDAIVTSPGDLRLAHQVAPGYVPVVPGNSVLTTAGGTIEIGAPVSTAPLSLACPELPIAAGSVLGRALQRFANLLLPGNLAAAGTGGSTGSQVVKFSPFAVVDTKLLTSSTGPASPQYIPLGNTQITAPVSVTLRARVGAPNGTPIDGIPVTFAPGPLGSFSPSPVATGADGTAGSTWTLVAGTNTGTGTPAAPNLGFTPSAANFSVDVIQETTLSFDGPATLPDGVEGAAYPGATFAASGGQGAGTYSWTVTLGSLPTGLALNSTTGDLSGTTTTAGTYNFTVTVGSGGQTQSRSYTVTITLPPVTITTASPLVPSATVGAFYSKSLAATGGAGAGSYTWSLATGSLPTGLGLSAAGLISGTPSALGDYSFDVKVTSGTGLTQVASTKTFQLSVINPTAITLKFDQGPSKSVCYALGVPMTPGIRVEVKDQSGNLLSGVTINMVAVTNNGAKVSVTPSSVLSSAGIASFGGPTINKTGGYALIASTGTGWPSATITSTKFTISPSCP